MEPDDAPKALRAKFRCNTVTDDGTSDIVNLNAVYAADGPNATWSKFTPAGSLSMTVSNPDARGFFKPGTEYFIDLVPA